MNQPALPGPWYIAARTSGRISGFHLSSWGLSPRLPTTVDDLRLRERAGTGGVRESYSTPHSGDRVSTRPRPIHEMPSAFLPAHLCAVCAVDAAVTLIARDRPFGGSCLSPAVLAPVRFGRRLLRRDVGGAIRPSCAGGRRLEGERDGSRSRRPAVTVSGRAPAMAPTPPTAERHMADRACMGSDPQGPTPTGGRSCTAGHKSPNAGAERQPPGREALEPERAPEEARAGLLGRLVRPAVADQAPANPSHLAGCASGADGACVEGASGRETSDKVPGSYDSVGIN